MAKKNWRKPVLEGILERRPDAFLVRNKYKVLVAMLRTRYPELRDAETARLEAVVFDAVNGNRDWQALTEGHDTINKYDQVEKWRAEHGYKPDGPGP